MVHPGQARGEARDDLPGVGAARRGDLGRRDPLPALRPDEHELVVRRVTGSPGTSVTSAMTASIATLPTSGTRRPRTSAVARFERARGQPSP